MTSPDDRSDRPHEPVVCVAVDGSRAARQAVLWAAVEARLRHVPLLVVHVVIVATESVGADASELSSQNVLESSAEAARELEPEIEVRTELLARDPPSEPTSLASASGSTVLALGIDPDSAAVGARSSRAHRRPRRRARRVPGGHRRAANRSLCQDARSQVTVGWTDGHTVPACSRSGG